jgi:hypothetical protein
VRALRSSTAQRWRKAQVLRSDLFEDRKIFVNRRWWLDGYASSVISRKAVALTETHAGFQKIKNSAWRSGRDWRGQAVSARHVSLGIDLPDFGSITVPA